MSNASSMRQALQSIAMRNRTRREEIVARLSEVALDFEELRTELGTYATPDNSDGGDDECQ